MHGTNKLIAITTGLTGIWELSPLSSAPKGGRLRIVDIPQGRARTQLIRLGIMKGEVVRCLQRLPGGTVVIEKNRQEIAIGASLAKTVMVHSAG